MQTLLKAGVGSLMLAVLTNILARLLGYQEQALLATVIVLFVTYLGLLITTQRGDFDRLMATDVMAGYAIGIILIDMLDSALLFPAIFSIFLLLRAMYVGQIISTKATVREPFSYGFLGGLPVIGILFSFAVMWQRAGKPRPPTT